MESIGKDEPGEIEVEIKQEEAPAAPEIEVEVDGELAAEATSTTDSAISQLRAQLGIPPETPVIGYIGSLVSYEGLPDLVRACAIIRDRGARFRLLIVGSGADAGRIQAAASEADRKSTRLNSSHIPLSRMPSSA